MDVGLHPLCLLRRSVQHHMPRVLHSALLLQAGAAPANDAYVRPRTPCWFLTLGSAIPTECCLASMTCIGYLRQAEKTARSGCRSEAPITLANAS